MHRLRLIKAQGQIESFTRRRRKPILSRAGIVGLDRDGQSAVGVVAQSSRAVAAPAQYRLPKPGRGLCRGIALPGRLSITGFDNLPLTEHIRPAITTVTVPAQDMGDTAAKAILAAIESGKRIRSREFPAPLLVRETTGVPDKELS